MERSEPTGNYLLIPRSSLPDAIHLSFMAEREIEVSERSGYPGWKV